MARNPDSPSSPDSPPRQGRNDQASQGESGESGESEARKATPLTRQIPAPDSREARASPGLASQASKASQEYGQSLHDRAVSLVTELRLLDVEAIRERHHAAEAKISERFEIPEYVSIAAETQPIPVAAAIQLLGEDSHAGRRVGMWTEYLTAARAAFDIQRRAPP